MARHIKTKLLFQSVKELHCTPRSISSQTLPRHTSFTSPDHGLASANRSAMSASPIETKPPPMSNYDALSILPLGGILRSLIVTSISSSPVLLGPSLKVMSALAHSQSRLLSPDHNPILRYFLKRIFYRQFCAGENRAEVRKTVDGLKNIGFAGVLLSYAREIVIDEEYQYSQIGTKPVDMDACIRNEINPWAKGTLETVELMSPGDFVAVKLTGAGSQALYDLSHKLRPSPALKEAIDSVCELAAARGVRLVFDAEQTAVQAGIDSWTLDYMRKYNQRKPGEAVVYGTYQAYLKRTPTVIASHLSVAKKEDFTIGVKLVRGAYLGSDPRHLIHDTKADTDAAYDGLAESLMRRSYGSVLPTMSGKDTQDFPSLKLVLGTHNLASVRKAQAIRNEQAAKGEALVDLIYAQLQGMADEVSCELVQAGRINNLANAEVPKVYKYLVWGTTGECMKYLLRRAQENKDALQRTKEERNAMASELIRRLKRNLGLIS